jgi:hypothetical protein
MEQTLSTRWEVESLSGLSFPKSFIHDAQNVINSGKGAVTPNLNNANYV